MSVLIRKNRTLKRILRNKFHAPAHDEPVAVNAADNEPAYSFSADIPKSYNDTYVRAIPRDPENTFVYWEVPQEQASSVGVPDKGNIHTFNDKAAWIQEKISAPPPVMPDPLPPPPKQPLPIPETIPSPFETLERQPAHTDQPSTHTDINVQAEQPAVRQDQPIHEDRSSTQQPVWTDQPVNGDQSSIQPPVWTDQPVSVDQSSIQPPVRTDRSVHDVQPSAHTEQERRAPWPIPPTRPSEFENMPSPEHHEDHGHYADHGNHDDNRNINDNYEHNGSVDHLDYVDHNNRDDHNDLDDLNRDSDNRNNRDIPLHHEICIHPGMSIIPDITLCPGMSLRITTHVPVKLDVLIRQLSCADPSLSSGIFYSIDAGEKT